MFFIEYLHHVINMLRARLLKKYTKLVTMLTDSKETEILSEIRDSEKKSEEIIERAKVEYKRILDDAKRNSLKLLAAKKQEISKLQQKKLMDFRAKAGLVKAEKVKEGKKAANQAKAKAEKNAGKAVEFAMKKFEEMT